jgi:DNA-binding transcriptional ArsR family regulator
MYSINIEYELYRKSQSAKRKGVSPMQTPFWQGPSASYQVQIIHSPIFECALGIAAITRPEVIEKLERTPNQWRALWIRLPDDVRREVTRAGEVHTWRSLLFLAHRCPGLFAQPAVKHVNYFCNWLEELGPRIRIMAAPFLGRNEELCLTSALAGNSEAMSDLLSTHADNEVVSLNLEYLFRCQPEVLRKHVESLLQGWYTNTDDHHEVTFRAVEQDASQKRQLATEMSVPSLVQLATRGLSLHPEPMVDTVLLVPQLSYRPFTIVNSLPGCSVFYYPVADENMPGAHGEAELLRVAAQYKAVGDVHRLKILMRLRLGKQSVAQLADYLQLAKSTTHHHLTLLRSAGLISTLNGVYELRPQALQTMHQPFHAILGLEEEAPHDH